MSLATIVGQFYMYMYQTYRSRRHGQKVGKRFNISHNDIQTNEKFPHGM